MPFYAIDLNVLFDLVRDRNRSDDARLLFGAALSHVIRVAVAGEFEKELTRTSFDPSSDALLQLARRLPRLPKVDKSAVDVLSAEIHQLVFEEAQLPSAGTVQAISDCRHVAHAILAQAAGFITSDRPLLAARAEVLRLHGLDIASLDELVSLLPSASTPVALESAIGEGFSCRALTVGETRSHLMALGASSAVIDEFCVESGLNIRSLHYGVLERDAPVAMGAIILPSSVDAPARILIQVPQLHPSAGIFADHIFNVVLDNVTREGPIGIELAKLEGQTLVARLAKERGFIEAGQRLAKVALGRPLTLSTWDNISRLVWRRIGIDLPPAANCLAETTVKDTAGNLHRVTRHQLENLLSPTIIAWPEREGVILPIRREFADQLLGTSQQSTLPLFEAKKAAFLALRAYVSSPRNAATMKAQNPVLFYESSRGGGRGALVAAGRVVDALVQPKAAVSPDQKKRLVVDDINPFSRSQDVLVTTFDNIIRFPRAITLRELKEIGAASANNFQAATKITACNLTKVLDAAWH